MAPTSIVLYVDNIKLGFLFEKESERYLVFSYIFIFLSLCVYIVCVLIYFVDLMHRFGSIVQIGALNFHFVCVFKNLVFYPF